MSGVHYLSSILRALRKLSAKVQQYLWDPQLFVVIKFVRYFCKYFFGSATNLIFFSSPGFLVPAFNAFGCSCKFSSGFFFSSSESNMGLGHWMWAEMDPVAMSRLGYFFGVSKKLKVNMVTSNNFIADGLSSHCEDIWKRKKYLTFWNASLWLKGCKTF